MVCRVEKINLENNGMKKELLTYRYREIDVKNRISFYNLFIGLNNKRVRYEAIEYGSLKIYPWFRILLEEDGCKVVLRWVKSSHDYNQGVRVNLRNARARLLDGSGSEIKNDAVLMHDFWFPDSVLLYCAPIRLSGVDTVKNRWFGLQNVCKLKETSNYMTNYMGSFHNTKRAWYGNYGVVIEATSANSYRLYFSCGYATNFNNITFEDLVLDVFIHGNHTTDFMCNSPRF